MYLLSLNTDQTESKVYELTDALVKAKERGVDVEVVLDQNIDFVEKIPKDEWAAKAKNQAKNIS